MRHWSIRQFKKGIWLDSSDTNRTGNCIDRCYLFPVFIVFQVFHFLLRSPSCSFQDLDTKLLPLLRRNHYPCKGREQWIRRRQQHNKYDTYIHAYNTTPGPQKFAIFFNFFKNKVGLNDTIRVVVWKIFRFFGLRCFSLIWAYLLCILRFL